MISLSEFLQPLCEIAGTLSNLPDTEILCSLSLTFQKLIENTISSFLPPLAPLFLPSSLSLLAPHSDQSFTVDHIFSLFSLPNSERLSHLTPPIIKHFLARYVPSKDATLLTLLSSLSNSIPPLIASYVMQILDQSFSPLSPSPAPSPSLSTPLSSPSPLLRNLESACEGFLYLSHLSFRSPNQATIFLPPNDPASLKLRLCNKIKHWSPAGRLSPLRFSPTTSPTNFSPLLSPLFSPFSPLLPILSLQFYKPDILSIIYSLEKRPTPTNPPVTFGESLERFSHSIEIIHLSLYAGNAVLPSLRAHLSHFSPATIFSLFPRTIDTSILPSQIIWNTPLSLWTDFFYPVPLITVTEKLSETLRMYRRVLYAITFKASCYIPSPRISSLIFTLQTLIAPFQFITDQFFFEASFDTFLPSLDSLHQMALSALKLSRLLLESDVENSITVYGPCRPGEQVRMWREEKEKRDEQNERNPLFLSIQNLQSITSPRVSPLYHYLLFNEVELWMYGTPCLMGMIRKMQIERDAQYQKHLEKTNAKWELQEAIDRKISFWNSFAKDRKDVDVYLFSQYSDVLMQRRKVKRESILQKAYEERRKKGKRIRNSGRNKSLNEEKREEGFKDERDEKEQEEWENREAEQNLYEERIDVSVSNSEDLGEVEDLVKEEINKKEERKQKQKEREEIWKDKRNYLTDPHQWNALYKDEKWSVTKFCPDEPLEFFEPIWKTGSRFVDSLQGKEDSEAEELQGGEHSTLTKDESEGDSERKRQDMESNRSNKSYCHSCNVERSDSSGERELRFWSLVSASLPLASDVSSPFLPSISGTHRYAALINDSLEWNIWRERYLIIQTLVPTHINSPVLKRYSAILSGTGKYHDLRWKHHFTESSWGHFVSKMKLKYARVNQRYRASSVIAPGRTRVEEKLEKEFQEQWNPPSETSDIKLAEHFKEEFEGEIVEEEIQDGIYKDIDKSRKTPAFNALVIQCLEELSVIFPQETRIRSVGEAGKYYSLWDAHHNFILAFLELLLFKSYEKFVQVQLPDTFDKVVIFDPSSDSSKLDPPNNSEVRGAPTEKVSQIRYGKIDEELPIDSNVKIVISLDKQKRFNVITEFLRSYFKVLVKKVLGKSVIQWIWEDQIRAEVNKFREKKKEKNKISNEKANERMREKKKREYLAKWYPDDQTVKQESIQKEMTETIVKKQEEDF